LLVPGSASAAGDCSVAEVSPPPYACQIVSQLSDSADPVSAGQVLTYTATMTNDADPSLSNGEDAPNVQATLGPDFFPDDDPGDFQSTAVTSQPPGGGWSCTGPSSQDEANCQGRLDSGESVTFTASYLVTGASRTVFFDLTMTDLAGEIEEGCGSGGPSDPGDCDDNDEDAFEGTDIKGSSSTGGPIGGSGGSGGGTVGGSVFDSIPPAFLSASFKPKSFLRGSKPTAVVGRKKKKKKTGTKIRYTLSEPATVTMLIERRAKGRKVKRRCRAVTRKNRKKRRCTRWIKSGTLSRRSVQGLNTVAFSGRVGRKKLKPARYRMTLVAVDAAGNRSVPRRLSFRVRVAKRKRARKR
jgi:hypothetical protein